MIWQSAGAATIAGSILAQAQINGIPGSAEYMYSALLRPVDIDPRIPSTFDAETTPAGTMLSISFPYGIVFSLDDVSLDGGAGDPVFDDLASDYLERAFGDLEWRGSVDAFAAVAAPIPEPGTYALMLTGLALFGFGARRRTAAAPI